MCDYMCDLALTKEEEKGTTYPTKEVVLEVELIGGQLLDRLEDL